ncbi:PP2C family protein-serine/threonine phosphatase [Cellulomonas telluris]|uniref:PP2C family protein-serine/threonine phosphatase n=1 Tax=Cellulomonas telluris TaxID=2306636 RepID=UPI0010A858D8|nr:PP2C family protein-serine/threonine phosphatase [Cellulomonas telluris]
MAAPTGADRQRRLIRAAQAGARLTDDELWLRYFALGGNAAPVELDAFLHGALELTEPERDRVALAVNEELDELSRRSRAPYSRTVRELEPTSGPLAAVVELLRRTHLVPPDALPAALDAAAALLGVRAVLYLADHPREVLVPLPGEHGRDRPALGVDATVPGRAFRLLRTQPTVSGDGQARLWVPVVDGVERVGVLDVMVDDRRDLEDPVLHRQCWLLAHYLGHLVGAVGRYGDRFERLRQTVPRTVEAELVAGLLPPMTAGTARVLVSARIEPVHDMGGDVVDYAFDEDVAHLAVLDATGHDLHAGLAAAAALAAYRTARRRGDSLFAQADAVHRALADHLDDMSLATGVLAQLDLRSGRLRYLAAGHPAPLLVRDGVVVKALTGGRRPILGLEPREAALGEEQLQPGDLLVLYTDGITEARDATGEQFGERRLGDALQRGIAEELPLPEVVRRVVGTILRHQQGVLQDDATLLLAHWTSEGQSALRPSMLR